MNTIASNQSFIVAAYAVTWIVIIGYTAWLAGLGRRARARHAAVAHESPGGTGA